jgi:hypothetical protein
MQLMYRIFSKIYCEEHGMEKYMKSTMFKKETHLVLAVANAGVLFREFFYSPFLL